VRGAAVVFSAYIGFEPPVSTAAQEANNPKREYDRHLGRSPSAPCSYLAFGSSSPGNRAYDQLPIVARSIDGGHRAIGMSGLAPSQARRHPRV